ncbi:DUF3052 domain-containing protein [Alkalihalobacillus deserti]|uniref:DUF3052 domain-containing protein n=1 Tax=Alkalihalobacillus deserti TaxID=2879466 RepID=UPI0027DF881C|nr:DUF3052 domain-containing protein [Alkalihalobacillus deserti]
MVPLIASKKRRLVPPFFLLEPITRGNTNDIIKGVKSAGRMIAQMEQHPVMKKLQSKLEINPILVLHAPKEYKEAMACFDVEVHTELQENEYGFIHVFGTTNDDLKTRATQVVDLLKEDGLLWLSYPKKTSKKYKGSDCNRDTVATLLGEHGFEPVRQVAVDEDWSALRFRHVSLIKTMNRTFAVTKEGKERTSKEETT